MTNLGMVYPLGGSHIKICWANGVVIISFRRWVVASRGNSFRRSWGSQTAKDKGRTIPPTTSTCGTLICCRLPEFEYNRSWGSYREVLSASFTSSVTSILEILNSDGWHPSCEFKSVWGAQGELHDLKAPPHHYYLVGVNDQDCLLIDATLECEHADLRVASATRHSLALATQSEQGWIQLFFLVSPNAFWILHEEFSWWLPSEELLYYLNPAADYLSLWSFQLQTKRGSTLNSKWKWYVDVEPSHIWHHLLALKISWVAIFFSPRDLFHLPHKVHPVLPRDNLLRWLSQLGFFFQSKSNFSFGPFLVASSLWPS